MSDVQETAIAILVSDLHLRHTVPSGRTEKSWYPVMKDHMQKLHDLVEKHEGAQIICAGDIFDRWNPPAELVSWALDNVPSMYAIPGQHDLNGHDYNRRMDGAYGALVKAGQIRDLRAEDWTTIFIGGQCISVWAQPWGRYAEPHAPPNTGTRTIQIRVIHKYLYDTPSHAYQGAPESGQFEKTYSSRFDINLSGDNHITWCNGKHNWLNPGSFMCMKQDQRDHTPLVGLVMPCGSLQVMYLNDLKPEPESWQARATDDESEDAAQGVLEALNAIETQNVSFEDRVFRAAEIAATEEVSKILREVWEKIRG